MENESDPLAKFGLDAIDLRWTLKDIAAKRAWLINKQHFTQRKRGPQKGSFSWYPYEDK